jgi:lysozyme
MKTSENGIFLIKHYEGKETLYSLLPEFKAYKCPGNKWTIGWGTTVYPDGSKVKEGDICNGGQARRWLFNDLKKIESEINLIPDFSQNEFDALVSFCYNVGINGFDNSTLLRRIKYGMTGKPIEEAFLMWSKANGEHDGVDNDGDGTIDEPGEKRLLEGLKKRRIAEATLYLTGKLVLNT